MATKIDIIADALVLLGYKRITSLDTTIEIQNAMNEIYEEIVKRELASSSWRFATKSVQLSQAVGSPPNNIYTYWFHLIQK